MSQRAGSIELGNFRLLGLLGEGSFASAYLAEQVGTERQAVVKIAHRHLLAQTNVAALKARFLDEVRASTRVQHPNLATIFTAGETADGLPAIAMEFVPGDSLEACLERSAPLAASELVYFGQLASVLSVLHRANIIHRDVSPSNVMITRDHEGSRRAMLLDFGIAQLEDAASATGPMGTPRYAAPEQISGRTEPASDLYGLGAILWWALTGHPYLQEIESLDRLISHQMHMQSAPDPRAVHSDIAPNLAELTMSLLHPEPSRRPTAAALLERWPSIVAEAQRWRGRHGQRRSTVIPAVHERRAMRLLVIDPQPVKRFLVAGYAERLGCQVTVAEDPRQATRGLLGEFDIAVMSTELGGIDAAKIGSHLREHFPAQRLLLMSSNGERVINCSDCDADMHLSLPGELGRFAEYLETLQQRSQKGGRTPIRTLEPDAPLSATVIEGWKNSGVDLQEAIRSFLGVMPTLITQLDQVPHSGLTREVRKTCDMIHDEASLIGALHLARLAKSLHMLLEAGELPNPAAYVAEVENEYVRVFRDLRQLVTH